jgi:hypothetical protein
MILKFEFDTNKPEDFKALMALKVLMAEWDGDKTPFPIDKTNDNLHTQSQESSDGTFAPLKGAPASAPEKSGDSQDKRSFINFVNSKIPVITGKEVGNILEKHCGQRKIALVPSQHFEAIKQELESACTTVGE